MWQVAALLVAGLALAACGTGAGNGPRASGGSGWAARAGHPTYKVGAPYQINGIWYYPRVDYGYNETGVASWYGEAFDKQATANGEIFDLNDLTAAHRTLPLPSVVEVTNMQNGRSMQLRVNDRGPFAQNRILDVSRRAAQLLGFERSGTTQVRVRILREQSIQVAQAAMRGSTGNVELASNIAAAATVAPVAATRPTPPLAAPQRPVMVAQAAPVRQAAPVTQAVPASRYGSVEVVASQPRPNPVEPQRRVAEVVEPEPPRAAAPEQKAAAPPRRAPWYAPLTPISSAYAEPLAPRGAPADRVLATAAPTRHGSGHLFIQAGAFSVPENAQRAQTRIASFAPVQVLPTSGRTLYRVRVGPVSSSAEADRLVTRLVQSGYPDARIVNE